MDTERLLEQLPKLEARAAQLREKEVRARRKAERVERQILGIRLLADAAERTGAGSPGGFGETRPSGVGAIRRLLGEDPGRIWDARSLHHELERRGWVSVTASFRLQGTEACLSRLVRRGEIDRLERGRYRPRAPGGARQAHPLGLVSEDAA